MFPIKTLVIFGTRPEAIKLAPLIKRLQQDPDFVLTVCVTAQHRQMLDQVLNLFEITPDFDLNLMQDGQDLTELTARMLTALKPVFATVKPDLVLVHGDTTTTFTASLASFYHKTPIAHIEAGLRTGNRFFPFPEEANRLLTAVLADYHFAPTETAKQHLLREGVAEHRIWVTGNTVIDGLFNALQKIRQNPPLAETLAARYPFLDANKKMILVTGHRRESFGEGFEQICQAIAELAERYPQTQIVYPVHLNPNVSEPVNRWLGKLDNVFLLEPQDYLPFVYLMDKAYLVLTDSGGIQEEAPALAKPVLVMRESSERTEAIEAGTVRLVGTDKVRIMAEVERLLNDNHAYSAMAQARNPYGDGRACERIITHLKQQFSVAETDNGDQ